MIDKKIKIKPSTNYLLHSLFQSKNFYGESVKKTDRELNPFIYGIRHNYTIINLKYTSLFFKRILKIVQEISRQKQKILIIGNTRDIQPLVQRKHYRPDKKRQILYWSKKWKHGFATNKDVNTFFKKQDIQLIVVLKSAINPKFLNKELVNLNIPIISLMNTDETLKNVTYPLIMNSNNIQSVYYIMYLLRKFF